MFWVVLFITVIFFKKITVFLFGELKLKDIPEIIRSGVPQDNMVYEQLGFTPNEPLFSKNYGLIGSRWGWNFNRVSGSQQTMLKLLKIADRKSFAPFSEIAGVELFLSQTGKEAMRNRKHLVNHLPRLNEVIATVLSESADMTRSVRIDDLLHGNRYGHLLSIARNMMMVLFFGHRLTDNDSTILSQLHDTAIRKFVSIADFKPTYLAWVASVVAECLDHPHDHPHCTFNRLLDGMRNKGVELSMETLLQDPNIHLLFLTVGTAEHIAEIMNTVFNTLLYPANSHYQYLKNDLIQEMEEVSLEKINESELLHCVYLESLSATTFLSQTALFRNLPRDVEVDGHLFASGELTLEHRSMEKKSAFFDPYRFRQSDAPKLGTSELAPFSYGPRPCIGDKIAEGIVKGVLGTAFHRLSSQEQKASSHQGRDEQKSLDQREIDGVSRSTRLTI